MSAWLNDQFLSDLESGLKTLSPISTMLSLISQIWQKHLAVIKPDSIQTLPFHQALATHYTQSVQSFIQRIRKSHPQIPIFLVALPWSSHEGTPNSVFKKLNQYWKNEGHTPFGKPRDHWHMLDQIQQKVLRDRAKHNQHAHFINLSEMFHQEIDGMNYRTYFEGDHAKDSHRYFYGDEMHYSITGNAYMADTLYNLLPKELLP